MAWITTGGIFVLSLRIKLPTVHSFNTHSILDRDGQDRGYGGLRAGTVAAAGEWGERCLGERQSWSVGRSVIFWQAWRGRAVHVGGNRAFHVHVLDASSDGVLRRFNTLLFDGGELVLFSVLLFSQEREGRKGGIWDDAM
ncbi:hypothetical protein F5144DRAFT_561659 [Chaetomium tenue]|uniref:Uncharacterized protein n=1 Tax=Chaetomium tenue TaxID=1854479 RepID=A0ACB7PL46_9PEZI|nr:hypothetical protein F5144DRAFT_561659 [Chaetomium globosum]